MSVDSTWGTKPMPNGAWKLARGRTEAFSLIELLVVIAIIVVLGVMTIPQISSTQRAMHISQAAARIQDRLDLARQLSSTRNLPVVISLCQTADSGGEEHYNALNLDFLNPDGTRTAAAKPVYLPVGMSVATMPAWSSVMQLPTTNTSVRGKSLVSKEFRLRPSGRTSLGASSNWFLTIYPHLLSTEPSKNFITLTIDPITARVVPYQP